MVPLPASTMLLILKLTGLTLAASPRAHSIYSSSVTHRGFFLAAMTGSPGLVAVPFWRHYPRVQYILYLLNTGRVYCSLPVLANYQRLATGNGVFSCSSTESSISADAIVRIFAIAISLVMIPRR